MRIWLSLLLTALPWTALSAGPKIVARFSFTIAANASAQTMVLHATKQKAAVYRILGTCFGGSVPGNEPDPVIRYKRYEDQGETLLSAMRAERSDLCRSQHAASV